MTVRRNIFNDAPYDGSNYGRRDGTWVNISTGGGSDTDAIHDNIAAEISAIAAKATPVAGDYLIIEDSAAGDIKKSITIGSISHDILADYVANEHIDWTAATVDLVTTADVNALQFVATGGSSLVRDVGNSYLWVGGDTSLASGAGVFFYGSAHATSANDVYFRQNGVTTLHYDFSAGEWDFQALDILTTGNITGASLYGDDLILTEQGAPIGGGAGTGKFYVKNTSPSTAGFVNDVGTIQELVYDGGAFHDAFSDYVANEHIDWTNATDNFQTTGTLWVGHGPQDTVYDFVPNNGIENGWSMYNWTTDTIGSGFLITKSRGGGVPGTHGAVVSGDNLLNWTATGSDGSSFNQESAYMIIDVDGTVATNSVPGRIRFGTTAVGSRWCSERMRITGAGNIGIGTTSPDSAALLDVVGRIYCDDQMHVRGDGTTPAAIEVGTGRSGDGNSYIDLIGDATYTDYGFRVLRAGGANGGTTFTQRGTGALTFKTNEAAHMNFHTSNTQRMTILSSGYVGIGTTGPTYRLQVHSHGQYSPGILIRGYTGTASSWARMDFQPRNSADTGWDSGGFLFATTTAISLRSDITNAIVALDAGHTGGKVQFQINHSEKMHIDSTTVNITGLPTSATGLATGDLWNDSGTVKVA